MVGGERVEELDVAAATLYRWKHQALIDVGRKPGSAAQGRPASGIPRAAAGTAHCSLTTSAERDSVQRPETCYKIQSR